MTGDGETSRVKLWFCARDELAPAVAGTLAAHWLSEHEQETAGRFLFERDRRQYLVAHALVRRALGLETGLAEAELVLRRPEHGRPCLQPPPGGLPRGGQEVDFNLAHVHGHSLFGMVRRHRIGVAAERLDRGAVGFDTIVSTFTGQEQDWVAKAPVGRPRDRRVLRLWTLKLAYTKARGLGLGLAFDAFSFTLAEDGGVVGFRPPDDDREVPLRFVELEPVPDVLAAAAVRGDALLAPVLELHHGFPWGRSAPSLTPLPDPVGAPEPRH